MHVGKKIEVAKNLSDFLPNDQEASSLNEFQENIHAYMMQKLALDRSIDNREGEGGSETCIHT